MYINGEEMTLIYNIFKIFLGAVVFTLDSMGSKVVCSAVSFTTGTMEPATMQIL